MAFGFFKKAEKADTVFTGGKIYTQDRDYPWAEAVAIKDGRVLTVGSNEDIDNLINSDTEVINLEGKTMLPGFIDMGGVPAAKIFKEAYTDLSDCDSWEELLEAIRAIAGDKLPTPIGTLKDIFAAQAEGSELLDTENIMNDSSQSAEGAANLRNGDSVFGGSFDGGLEAAKNVGGFQGEEEIDPDTPVIHYELGDSLFAYCGSIFIPKGMTAADVRAALDEVSPGAPLLLMMGRNNAVLLNTPAAEYAQIMAKQEGQLQVTLPFLVDILALIDFDHLQHEAMELAASYCERGYTSVVNNGFIDYFDQTYNDMLLDAYDNELLKQRFIGKLGINGPTMPEILVRRLRQRQTICTDLRPTFNADGLIIDVTSQFGLKEPEKVDLTPEEAEELNLPEEAEAPFKLVFDNTNYMDILHAELLAICSAVADAGMNIKVCVHDKDAALEVLDVFGEVQNKGYRKNIYTIAHELEFDDEERANYGLGETILETSIKGCEFTENSVVPGSGGFTMNAGAPEISRGIGASTLYRATDVENAVDLLTIDAAYELGMMDDLGSIEKGKVADFAIFEKNPLECPTLEEFKKIRACQTVIGGQIVYDEDEEVAEEWYNLLVNQQF